MTTSRLVDITGKLFGAWTAIARAGSDVRRQAIWLCRCECGKESLVPGYRLRSGGSTSCGCKKSAACSAASRRRTNQRPPDVDMVGHKYGRWTVVSYEKQPGRHGRWHCVCACGAERNLIGHVLRSGMSKSCGCLLNELRPAILADARARIRPKEHRSDLYRVPPPSKATQTIKPPRHPREPAVSQSPTYVSWKAMIHRCTHSTHPAYHRYGGRGIRVCDRWIGSLVDFVADMGERPSRAHSIDRIDVNGNYEPGNCRWATRLEQGVNKSTNRYVNHDGMRLSVREWSRRTGIGATTIRQRLDLGWLPAEALTRVPFAIQRSRDDGRQLYVYFVYRRSDDLVKIGMTTNMRRRIVSLRVATGEGLIVLASSPAGRSTENDLHFAFRRDNVKGEWFLLSAPLLELIKQTGRVGSLPHEWPTLCADRGETVESAVQIEAITRLRVQADTFANGWKRRHRRSITVDGEQLTVRQIADKYGLPMHAVQGRLARGMHGSDLVAPLRSAAEQHRMAVAASVAARFARSKSNHDQRAASGRRCPRYCGQCIRQAAEQLARSA